MHFPEMVITQVCSVNWYFVSGCIILPYHAHTVEIALRPKDAVENELDVCIQNSGVTGDCSSSGPSGLGLAWFNQEEGKVSNVGGLPALLAPPTFTGTAELFQGEIVVLMNANKGEIVCLEPSFDKLFGRYGDLNGDLPPSRLQNAAFSVCEPFSAEVNRFQRYVLQKLDASNVFVLRPQYYATDLLLKGVDACLAPVTATGNVKVVTCPSDLSTVSWRVTAGQLVTATVDPKVSHAEFGTIWW